MMILSQFQSPLGGIYCLLAVLLCHRVYLCLYLCQHSHPASAMQQNQHWLSLARRLAVPVGMAGTMIALGKELDLSQIASLASGVGHMVNTTIIGLLISITATALDILERHVSLTKANIATSWQVTHQNSQATHQHPKEQQL